MFISVELDGVQVLWVLCGNVGGGGGVQSERVVCYNINNIALIFKMEELQESSAEQVHFALDQIVWAKITGYPWWPATITALPSPKQQHFRVHFLADNSHAFVGDNKMIKYQQKRMEFDLHKHIAKGLRRAIVAADAAFEEVGSASGGCSSAAAQVEGGCGKQKQLLQLPLIQQTPLQEKLDNHLTIASQRQIQQPAQQSESEEQEEMEQQQQQGMEYSRQQRQRFVCSLLRKYQLHSIPRPATADSIQTRIRSKLVRGAAKKRESLRRTTCTVKKTKKIRKQVLDRPIRVLLARKILSLLKEKGELCISQRKSMSMSLSKEVNSGEEFVRLSKWIEISACYTVANFYDKWTCLQSEKEKSSSMTVEEL